MATLTKAVKNKMIRNIMADIPKEDIEKVAQDEFTAAVVERLPQAIKTALKDSAAAEFVNQQRVQTGCGKIYFTCYGPVHYLYNVQEWNEYAGQAAVDLLLERCAEVRARDDARRQIERELHANFDSVRTIKQFEERFPDLAKYLPARTVTVNLPATNDLVEKLKAAGLKQEAA